MLEEDLERLSGSRNLKGWLVSPVSLAWNLTSCALPGYPRLDAAYDSLPADLGIGEAGEASTAGFLVLAGP